MSGLNSTQFCQQQVLRKAPSILVNDNQVVYSMFETVPSGRWFTCPMYKTKHEKFFIPVATSLVNGVKMNVDMSEWAYVL